MFLYFCHPDIYVSLYNIVNVEAKNIMLCLCQPDLDILANLLSAWFLCQPDLTHTYIYACLQMPTNIDIYLYANTQGHKVGL